MQIIMIKKNKKKCFFLDIYVTIGILFRCITEQNRLFQRMFERNSLAVTGFAHMQQLYQSRQERINSIADNFGICSWRPDSEKVASRAFAQTPVEIKSFGG